MSIKIAAIQETIASALNGLPGVFSTVQWGGRAYKLPGPGGNKRKPKLLAHTWLSDKGDAVGISFKLDRKRAEEIVDQFVWIQPHSFRTLAPSGWITAEVRTKQHCRVVTRLLTECRSQFPIDDDVLIQRGKLQRGDDSLMRRIDQVLRDKRAAGWKPDQT